MKVFIVFTTFLAITLAGGHQQHYPIHIPVIGKTGVPLEPVEVVHTRQAHLSHVAAVKSHQEYDSGYYDNAEKYSNDRSHTEAGVNGDYDGNHYGYAVPIIGHNGVPVDTPEVQAAKSAHFAALAKATKSASYGNEHYRNRRETYGSYAVPVIGHNGVPVETPEVQAAKAEHFAAHAKSGSYQGAYLNGNHGGYEAHTYPKLAHNGQPIETPEVQALTHAHFAAHADALSRIGNSLNNKWNDEGSAESYNNQQLGNYGNYNGVANSGYKNALSHSELNNEWGYTGSATSYSSQQLGGHGTHSVASSGYGAYNGPIHIPKINHNGVPIETPEVQAAKSAHFAALAKATKSASYGNEHYRSRRETYGSYAVPVIGHNGVPVETPEVQAAKAEHFAAHAKSGSYQGAYLNGNHGGYEAHTYPKLAHNGQPIETPEVQALTHAHFTAHADALSRIGNGLNNEWNDEISAGLYNHQQLGNYNSVSNSDYNSATSYSNQQLGGHESHSVASSGHGAYNGPIHIPKIGHDGVPIDTPEVQHARLQHYAALAKASSRPSSYGLQEEHHY